MTHQERMLAALSNRPYDKIPHGEFMIPNCVVEEISGKRLATSAENAFFRTMSEPYADEEFEAELQVRNMLGFDYINVFPTERYRVLSENSDGTRRIKNLWGVEQDVLPSSSLDRVHPIPDICKQEHYRFPDVDAFDYGNIRRWSRDSDLFVFAQIDTGFYKMTGLLGFNEYMYATQENENDLDALAVRCFDYSFELAKKAVENGADAILLANDLAFNAGTFVSLEHTWRFDLSHQKKLVERIKKELRVPVCMHTCGNLNKVFPLLLDTGIDGLHPMEPAAGNDIYQYKQLYGDRVCLMGNLDVSNLLPQGSPLEVAEEVHNLCEKMSKGYRYILATCSSFTVSTPAKNAVAMHLAAERYGTMCNLK